MSLNIRFNLGTKFELKLTILIFWTEFAKKKCIFGLTQKT